MPPCIMEITIPDGTTVVNTDSFNALWHEQATEADRDSDWWRDLRGEWLRNIVAVHIPNTVTSIEVGAFAGWGNLTSVTFEANSTLELIKMDAFLSCEKLSEFHCPPSVITIGVDAFRNCTHLKTVTLSNLMVEIADGCFRNSRIETLGETPLTITIPAQIQSIGEMAFQSCKSATRLFVTNGPDDLRLREDAFDECTALKSVMLHRVTEIERGAFGTCRDMRIVCMSDRLVTCGSWDCHTLILAVAGPPRKIGTLLDVWTGRKATEWDPFNSIGFAPIARPRIPVLHTLDWDIQWGNERQIGNEQAEDVNQIKKDRTPLALISSAIQTAHNTSVAHVNPNDINFNNLYNLAMLQNKEAARNAMVLFGRYYRSISALNASAAAHGGGAHARATPADAILPNLKTYYDMALNVTLKPLMEGGSFASWNHPLDQEFPECTSELHAVSEKHAMEHYSQERLRYLWRDKNYQYCTVERRQICGVCHASIEHDGHEHTPLMDHFKAHKFPKDWRKTLPIELKVMILGLSQVEWMSILRDFNLVENGVMVALDV
jgi:hypothetical protein